MINALVSPKKSEEENSSNLQTSPSKPHPATKKSFSALLPWIFWGCGALFYLYEYILRITPSALTNELMLHFTITSSALGLLSSAYYYAYVPLQIPCGVIVDWLGPRKVICGSTLLCIIGSFLFAVSDNYYGAFLARFLMGAGSACAYISCVKVGADWFVPQQFALIAAITQMMGILGGIFGTNPFALLSNAVGWQEAMKLLGVAGFFVLAVAWLFMKEKKKPAPEKITTDNLLEGLGLIKSNPQSWLIALYGGLMFVPISAFADLWGTPFLMQLYNINNAQASFAGTMVYLGFAAGTPLGAMLSNALKSRKKVMTWSPILTIFPFMAVIYLPGISYSLSLVLLFIAGLVCGGQILYFAAAKENNPSKYSATAIGFTNAGVMVSALIFQPLMGYILDFVWDGVTSPQGTPLYSVQDYQQALTTIPICMLCAWGIMLFIKETFPHNKENR